MDPEDLAFLLKLKNEGKTKQQVASEWESRKADKQRHTASIAAELKHHSSDREASLIDQITQVHNDTSMNLQEKQQLIAPLLAEQKALFDERVPPSETSAESESNGSRGLISKAGMQLPALLEAVDAVKSAANQLFRTDQTELAMKEYLRMIWLLQKGNDDFDPQAVLPLNKMPVSGLDGCEEVWAVALLNCAAAALQLKQWARAKLCTRAVLLNAPEHPKALFRTAQAMHGCGELDTARDVLQQLLSLSPTDAAARKLLKSVNADYKKAQKQFGGMFERGGELYTAAEVERMHAAEQEEQLQHELGAAQRRRLARHMTREVHGLEHDPVEKVTSQLPAGTYGLQMDDLIGLSDDQKRKKLGLAPAEPPTPLIQKPQWMAERHYTQLQPLHHSGCTPDLLRREYSDIKAKEREWVRQNWSIEQEVSFECLLEAKAAPGELDKAFEAIYQELVLCDAEGEAVSAREGKDVVMLEAEVEVTTAEEREDAVVHEAEDEAASAREGKDVVVAASVCVQEHLQQLLNRGAPGRDVVVVLVDRQAEIMLNPLQRRRIRQFEKLVQQVVDGIVPELDNAHIEALVVVANEIVASWLKSK